MSQRSEIEQVSSSLESMGLNEYQSKALSGLIVLGESTAPQLADFSKIPRSRIYCILDNLIEMNTVRKKPGRPARFQVINPANLTNNIILWNRRRLEESIKAMEKPAEDVKSNILKLGKVRGDVSRDFIKVVNAGETSLTETKKNIRKSRQEILIISNVMEYVTEIICELKKATDRGVKIHVLLNKQGNLDQKACNTQDESMRVLSEIGALIRHVDETPLRTTIIDKSFIIFSVREDKNYHYKKDMIISEHKNMIKALKKYFNNEWNNALQ